MSRQDESAWGEFWRVMGPIVLILTGAGWLAAGLVASSRMAKGFSTNCGPGYVTLRSDEPNYVWPRPRATRSGPPIVNPATGHWYGVIDAPTWNAGQGMAASMAGRLVTIDDAAEQAWLVSTFGGDEPFWIGLTDADNEGRGRWANHEPAAYTNWAEYEPNNMYRQGEHFAVMNWRQQPGKWNDMNAESARASDVVGAVVEWESPALAAPPANGAGGP